MSKSLLLAIDFDDTIARNDCFPEVGEPIPGAIEGLKKLAEAGHRIQIWTCRHGVALENAKVWLDHYGIPHERINENCPVLIEQWGETRKMSADVYIDDKNLGGLEPWPVIVRRIEQKVQREAAAEKKRQAEALPVIIGISGRRGSGKDTVAGIIQELTGEAFLPSSFAGTLKMWAKDLTGLKDVSSQEAKTTFLPEWGMTVGQMLQKLGTDAIRNGLHENAWVLACFAGMDEGRKYIITDCRFANEADAIRAKGGVVIRIEGDPLKQQGDGTRDDTHPSETSLDDYPWFDAIIDNSGTLDQLRGHVSLMLEHLSYEKVSPELTGAPLTYNEAVYTDDATVYKRKYARGSAAPIY